MAGEESNMGLLDRVNNYLLLVYAAACFLMNYSISGLLYLAKVKIYLILAIPGIVGIFLPFLLLSRRSSLGFATEFSLKPTGAKAALASIVVAATCILPFEAMSTLLERARPPDADYISFVLSIKPKDQISFALVALGVIIVAPFAEELLFRGLVLRVFARNMSASLAIVLSGILFGISHFNLTILPVVSALGVIFGFVFYATRSLYAQITVHALFNLYSLLRLYRASEEEIVSSQGSLPDIGLTILSAIGLAASLAFLARLSKR